MRHLLDMLRSTRGESMVETIVSFAVVTIALLAFVAFTNAGAHLTGATTQLDAETGEALGSPTQGTVKIYDGDTEVDGSDTSITIRGNDGDIYSYEKATE